MGEGRVIVPGAPSAAVVSIASMLLAGFAAAAQAASDAPPPAPAIVARATNVCFPTIVHATGILVPRQTAFVMLVAPGFRLTEVSAREGDEVTGGQQLALASPREGQPPTGGSTSLPVRATAPGLILRSTARVGLVLSAGADPLFTLAVKDEIEMMADIPSPQVAVLSAGQTARIGLDDGRDVPAHVRLVPAEIDRATRTGEARISIDGRQALKAGSFARVAIDAPRPCGVAVPRSALIHGADGTSLQVVRDGIVATRRIRVGLSNDTDAEIVEGLAEGDIVVANAGAALRDGDRVRPLSPDLQEIR